MFIEKRTMVVTLLSAAVGLACMGFYDANEKYGTADQMTQQFPILKIPAAIVLKSGELMVSAGHMTQQAITLFSHPDQFTDATRFTVDNGMTQIRQFHPLLDTGIQVVEQSASAVMAFEENTRHTVMSVLFPDKQQLLEQLKAQKQLESLGQTLQQSQTELKEMQRDVQQLQSQMNQLDKEVNPFKQLMPDFVGTGNNASH